MARQLVEYADNEVVWAKRRGWGALVDRVLIYEDSGQNGRGGQEWDVEELRGELATRRVS